jgi:broad specificity phosphatase PhoE
MNKQQTVVFLVRHGDTDRAYSSNPAEDGKRLLTEGGKQQIKRVGEYLKDFAPVAVYSSPMERVQQTAAILRTEAGVDAPVIIEPELHEIYDDRSYGSVGSRVGDFLQKIIAAHAGQQLVCATHMDVIESLLKSLKVTSEEAQFPCRTADCYRLVFADTTFVECAKIPIGHEG